jgi:hypothetical protein
MDAEHRLGHIAGDAGDNGSLPHVAFMRAACFHRRSR